MLRILALASAAVFAASTAFAGGHQRTLVINTDTSDPAPKAAFCPMGTLSFARVCVVVSII